MKRILSVLAVLLLLVYIGYQVSANLVESIKTVDAVMVDAEDKITAQGIFVRSTVPLSGAGAGAFEYLVESGEKVSAGQSVVACFDSAAHAEDFRARRLLESDIANAQRAYETMTGDDGGLSLDMAIFSAMRELSVELADARVWAAGELYTGLVQDVVAREYPRDGIDGLAMSIAEMRDRLSAYNTAASGTSFTIEAPVSGYFVSSAEGSQTLCTVDEMYSLTPETLSALAESDFVPSDGDAVGYLIDKYDWYFVCGVGLEDAAALEQRGSVELFFPNLGTDRVSAKVHSVTGYNDGAVAIFTCGHVNGSFLGGVRETADIVMRTYSGIRVPREALHHVDDQWGVYCLSGAMLKFKPVTRIYQGDNYYLVKPAADAGSGLYLYDKIVVKGKNLQQNMVIK